MSIKKNGLNIYFSASSAKLDVRRDLYQKIIKVIESLGAEITYNWFEDKQKLSSEQIFEKASNSIKKSDVVIAEVTYPSTGVGQQIGLALEFKIPVIALQQEGKKEISRFAVGTQSSRFEFREYTLDNLKLVLKESLSLLVARQHEKFNFISTKEINEYLDKKSKEYNLSRSQYLRRLIRDHMATENLR